jgi:hypothetical protein
VAKTLRDDLGMDAGLQGQRGVGVAQVVQPDLPVWNRAAAGILLMPAAAIRYGEAWHDEPDQGLA